MAGGTEGIGSDVVNAMGYDGRGKKVAILDTGLDTAHEAFSEAPQEQAMTLETLKAQMDQVELHAKLDGAEDVYVSGKIPYAYDYGSGQAGAAAVQDTSGHGTHVAGTVAGSCSDAGCGAQCAAAHPEGNQPGWVDFGQHHSGRPGGCGASGSRLRQYESRRFCWLWGHPGDGRAGCLLSLCSGGCQPHDCGWQ